LLAHSQDRNLFGTYHTDLKPCLFLQDFETPRSSNLAGAGEDWEGYSYNGGPLSESEDEEEHEPEEDIESEEEEEEDVVADAEQLQHRQDKMVPRREPRKEAPPHNNNAAVAVPLAVPKPRSTQATHKPEVGKGKHRGEVTTKGKGKGNGKRREIDATTEKNQNCEADVGKAKGKGKDDAGKRNRKVKEGRETNTGSKGNARGSKMHNHRDSGSSKASRGGSEPRPSAAVAAVSAIPVPKPRAAAVAVVAEPLQVSPENHTKSDRKESQKGHEGEKQQGLKQHTQQASGKAKKETMFVPPKPKC